MVGGWGFEREAGWATCTGMELGPRVDAWRGTGLGYPRAEPPHLTSQQPALLDQGGVHIQGEGILEETAPCST